MRLNHFNVKYNGKKVLITNDMGRFMFLEKEQFRKLIGKELGDDPVLLKELIDAHMVFDNKEYSFSDSNIDELRAEKSHCLMATSLHIFVVTTACNMDCVYCQANNGTRDTNKYMTIDIAEKAVDIALQSPEKYLSFEFQGGEPLLNFAVIKHIVEYTEEKNKSHVISYNVVTNLTLLTEEMCVFFRQYSFGVSTSVDGAPMVHNRNRRYKSKEGTLNDVKKGIILLRNHGVSASAIETTTKSGLVDAEGLIATYRELGFHSVFLRPLTPLGKALINWSTIGYEPEEYIAFYREVLDKVIQMNISGYAMIEQHSAILLKKMYGIPVNYMELRSPCGAGIGQLAYYVDGRIFTCDEGRMLAEMGDDSFMLGNVFKNTYVSLIENSVCRAVVSASIIETVPSCCDCVYQPYCGICPVVNYALWGDLIERQPNSYRCSIFRGMLDYLFHLLQEEEPNVCSILHSWIEQ